MAVASVVFELHRAAIVAGINRDRRLRRAVVPRQSPIHAPRCTRFETRDKARREVFAYIETYYNRQRAHSAIGYIIPEQAELRYA